MRRRVLGALILLFLLLFASFSLIGLIGILDTRNTAADPVLPAMNYLAENYNSTLGLISDTPHGSSYYIYSSNFLASFALQAYGSGNKTLSAIALNVSTSVQKYLRVVPNPANQYMVLTKCVGFFNTSKDFVVSRIADSTVLTTQNNGSSPLGPSDYADIAFLKALYDQCSGQSQQANQDFQIAIKMYDGTGFVDSAFKSGTEQGWYQTYKLALCIFVGEALGYRYPASVETNLLRMQSPSGGFYAHYSAGFSTGLSVTNTETTSLSILALARPGGTNVEEAFYIVSLPAIAVVAILTYRRTIRQG
jgi:hypothetical protein